VREEALDLQRGARLHDDLPRVPHVRPPAEHRCGPAVPGVQ
jgi:hypothetical protein